MTIKTIFDTCRPRADVLHGTVAMHRRGFRRMLTALRVLLTESRPRSREQRS